MGLPVALGTLERTRLGAAAQAVGIAQGATDYATQYAKEREQFGRAIATFQAVSQRTADTYINKEAMKLTAWQAAWRLDADTDRFLLDVEVPPGAMAGEDSDLARPTPMP